MCPDEELPFALQNLARLLPLRRHRAPYNLLLTSSISLTPELLVRICGINDRVAFRKFMEGFTPNDRLNTLAYHFETDGIGAGYQALAELLLDGYFSTIVTTNTDSLLENALLTAGVRTSDTQVLLVGRDQPAYIVDALLQRSKPITILKLNGSLNERVLHPDFPDVLTYPEQVEEFLARFLAQDMIIVGDLERELALQRLLPVLNRSALYVVMLQTPEDGKSYVLRILEARNYTPSSFIVHGLYGTFHTFFPALFSLLHSGATTVVEVPNTQVRLSSSLASQLPEKAEPEKVLQISEASYQCDVLLITATQTEARAVLEACKNERRLGFSAGHHPYHDLGLIGNARVALMLQPSMGAGGLGGTRFTVDEGIQELRPSAVIMVGIACGLKPGEQSLGDILVSESIMNYEPQRIGTRQQTLEPVVQPRSGRIFASPLILSYFKNGQLLLDFTTWPQPPHVFSGLLLSGDKLLDNIAMREALLMREPEALGLEMEGVGLYEAATRARVDWLLVKAISDWGDGNKAENKEQLQQRAAENAARFTLEIIAQGGFAGSKKPESHRDE